MKTYTIKPLVWETETEDAIEQRYVAYVPFGSFFVHRFRGSAKGRWCAWEWGYCFADCFDEYEKKCNSLKTGKQKARRYWRKRMLPALEEAKEGKTK